METYETNYKTKHAEKRSQQRGVTSELIALHEKHADEEWFVGSGFVSRTLSDTAVAEMKLRGIQQQKVENSQRK